MNQGADLQDVANHEASHAVAWWWWVNQPGGVDDSTGGTFEYGRLTMGEFDPGVDWPLLKAGLGRVEEAYWQGFEHHVMTGLAGPISDGLLGREVAESGTDLAEVWERLEQVFYPDEQDALDQMAVYLRDTRDFLESTSTKMMVAEVAFALLARKSLTSDEAVALMERVVDENQLWAI